MLGFWKKLNEIYGWLVIIFFSFIMLIGIWQVYDNYYMYTHTLDNSILRYKPDPSDPAAAAGSPITDDMVGWITIDGTNIDYPVMQGKDNSAYLSTDPFGEYSLTGSIFLDSRCSSDFSDEFSLIYGHHMDYGKMFGALDDFLDENYLASHKTGTLLVGRTNVKEYKLEVFASASISSQESIVFDLDKDNIRQFIRDNTKTPDVGNSERILALATCADANSSKRTVVFCCIKE